MAKNIVIKGARVNNLKNISVDIPRDKLVILTGLSGLKFKALIKTRRLSAKADSLFFV